MEETHAFGTSASRKDCSDVCKAWPVLDTGDDEVDEEMSSERIAATKNRTSGPRQKSIQVTNTQSNQ